MAERERSRFREEIDFADSNPATEAFQKGTLFDQRTRANDLAAEHQINTNQFEQRANPQRLRSITADAATNEVRAKYAEPAAATALEGHKLQNEGLGIQNANARMQGFYKVLDLAKSGDVEGARAVAAQTGQKVPEELFQSAELRGAVDAFRKQAEARSPGRPQDQEKFIQDQLKLYTEGVKNGGSRAVSPTAPFQTPEGAPEAAAQKEPEQYTLYNTPPDAAGKPQPPQRFTKFGGALEDIPGATGPVSKPSGAGGAGAGMNPTALQKNAEYYVKNGIAPDIATAVNMLRESVTNPSAFNRLVQAEKKIIANNPAYFSMSDARVEELARANVRGRAGMQTTTPPAVTPPATAAPAVTPPATPAPAVAPATVAPPSPQAATRPPNDQQIAALRNDPSLATEFDRKFGPGAAARILSGL